MEPALREINIRIPLEVWAVDRKGRLGATTPPVTQWFSADDPQNLRTLAGSLSQVRMAVVATWNETHIPLLLYLLGKVPVVLVEKPLTDDLEMARLAVPFVQAATPTTTCMCIDHYLAKPSVRHVLGLARAGTLSDPIGDLRRIRFSMREARPIEAGREHLLRKGLFQDMLIHGFQMAIDLVPDCLTNPVQIEDVSWARYENAPISAETSGKVEAILPGNVRATFLIGKGTLDEKTLTLEGSRGTLVANIDTGEVQHLSCVGSPPSSSAVRAKTQDDAYKTVLEEALGLASPTRGPAASSAGGWLVSYPKALRAMELVEAARVRAADLPMETHPAGTIPEGMAETRLFGGCTVEVYDSPEEAALAVAREIIVSSRTAIRQSGRFVMVIPGGRSFLETSQMLALRFGHLDFCRFQVFLTDEHAGLPETDKEVNYRLAIQEGGWGALVEKGLIPVEALHRIPTQDAGGGVLDEVAIRKARVAGRYEEALHAALGGSGPDLMILGMGGADCHTASILPEKAGWTNPLLTSERDYAVVNYPDAYGLRSPLRVSVTAKAIRSSSRVILLAFGVEKQKALTEILMGPVDLARRPASVIRFVGGRIIADRAAARSIVR